MNRYRATAGDRGPTRRRVLKLALWGVGLAALVAPSAWWALRAARPKWALLPPRPIDWTMKPPSSAKIEERALPDGRIELSIEHDLLRGVTPAMLAWWWRNIDGTIEIDGRSYPRYLIWHPIDHIHFEVLDRQAGGTVGVGSSFHVVEALGANLRHLIDVTLVLRRLDESGATVEARGPLLGRGIVTIDGRFVAQDGGTQITSVMTIGSPSWAGRLGLNRALTAWWFPAERRKAWTRHSVEEIGNLQFFLPRLYRTAAGGAATVR